MALDPSIILGAKSPQFDLAQFSPVNTLASAMKLKQLQQEGDINALNLRERQGLQQFLSGGRETEAPNLSSPEARTMLATRFGETGRKVATSLTDIDKAQAALQKAETDERVRRNALTVSKTAQYKDLLANVNDQRSALQWIQMQQQDPDLADSPIAKVSIMDAARNIPADPAGFNQWKQQAALGITKFIELNKPQFMQQDFGGTKRIVAMPGLGGEATTVGGTEQAVTMTPAQEREARDSAQRIKQEGQRIGLEGRRVAVLEENNRRDADPAFQQRMGAAKATGEAIAKGDVAAQQALPKVISRAEESVRLIDEMIGKRDSKGQLIKGSKPHPGFNDTVGTLWSVVARNIPGTDAADFASRFDQVKGASFLEAFESLKGGGAITEKEGAKATDAINRMSLAQSENEFVRAAMDLQDVVRKGVANAQAKAARSGGGGVAPAAGASNIDALLQKYK